MPVLWCSIVWIDEKLVSQEGKQTRPAVDSFFTLKKTIHAHKNTDLKLLVQIKIIAHFCFHLYYVLPSFFFVLVRWKLS